MEGQGQQASFVKGLQQRHDLVVEIEERLFPQIAIRVQNIGHAHLFTDEAPIAAVGGFNQEYRCVQAVRHQFKLNFGICRDARR
ncbi:MAG: hypothetical protein VCE75_19170 [Alphaproteobacteria bacterium]